MPSLAAAFERVVELIRAADRFLICSHESPEGDCLGASLALHHALVGMGKEVHLFNADVIPPQYRFLNGADRFARRIPEGTFGAIFVVDCGRLERIGRAAGELTSRGPIVNLDHHLTNNGFGQINVIAPELSSAGELIYRLLTHIPVPIDRDIAEAVYAGILTDTGSFHYSNTSDSTFEVARELMAAGMKPAVVANGLYENMPLSRVRLLSRVLETLELAPNGRWASLRLTREMREMTGASLSDAEGFINFARGIEGVEVAMLYREVDDGVSVSLRSKGLIDVAGIASSFGGGGHHNAAAFSLATSLEAAVPEVVARVERALELISSSGEGGG